ncbi:hypothetical protein ABW20_dc0100031 [Dactylellina cionopaga]|nr:hypothetical protein ABW20_dc0100031 [Dactylellina cionopaga]
MDWFTMDYENGPAHTNEYIQNRKQQCQDCICDDTRREKRGSPLLTKQENSIFCFTDAQAAACREVYDCQCKVSFNLKDDGEAGGTKMSSLNSGFVPPNKDYNDRKRLEAMSPTIPGIKPAWMRFQDGDVPYNPLEQLGLKFANHRKIVSGTAEPYFVEGLSKDNKPTWNYLFALGAGYANFLADKSTSRYPKGQKRPLLKRTEEVTAGPEHTSDVISDGTSDIRINTVPNSVPNAPPRAPLADDPEVERKYSE